MIKYKIKGEYWIINGSANYADGDNGDKNHEIIAYEHIASQYLKPIHNLASSLELKIPSFQSIESDYEDVASNIQSLLHVIKNKLNLKDPELFLGELSRVSGIDLETIKVLVQGMSLFGSSSNLDPRVYVMKRENWIAVRNNNIELFGIDQSKIKSLISGLDDILDQEGEYDIEDENIEFNLYDFKTNKSIDLTLEDIKNNKLFKPKTLPQTTYNYSLPALAGKQHGRELWRGTSESFSFKNWIESTIAMGQCFPYANNLAMEILKDEVINEKDVFVCHGEVEEPFASEPKRYLHAWVEVKFKGEERVYDWQMNLAKNSLSKIEFYRLFKPSNITKYTVEQSMINCLKHKHHGPWS